MVVLKGAACFLLLHGKASSEMLIHKVGCEVTSHLLKYI